MPQYPPSRTHRLTVRRLLIDLNAPFGRRWNGGDAFRTAFFNALSMSFPAGEQMFIDAVKRGMAELPPEKHGPFAGEVQAFIGQEATHRHIHTRFNAHLARQGLVNHWEARILQRRQKMEAEVGARNWLAMTAATEHLTAIFSELLLAHPEVVQGSEERLRDLWTWHCCEETEHRSTAFDLYRALGGNEEWRLRIFRAVSGYFLSDLLRQTLNNLWHDGTWWRPGTWLSAAVFLFGSPGVLRRAVTPWRLYLRADFHPAQSDASKATEWLAAHTALAPAVRPAP